MGRKFTPHYADVRGAIIDVPGTGIMFAQGTTVPTDGTGGYGGGCLFLHNDGGNNASLYCNEGTNTSCDFNLVAVDVPVDFTGLTSSVAELNILTGVTATASEINQHCDESANTETVTTTNVITATESGKTFFLSSATEFVSTLPAPAAGLRFTFVIAAAPSGADYTIVTNGSSNIILGNVVTSQDAGGSADSEQTGGDTISFVSAKAVVGDRVDLVCDGTNWFATGFCKVFDAITITTAT